MPAYVPGVTLPVRALGFMFPNSAEQAHLGTLSLYIEDWALKVYQCCQQKATGSFSWKTEESACDRFLISDCDRAASFTAETPALLLADSHYLLHLSLAINFEVSTLNLLDSLCCLRCFDAVQAYTAISGQCRPALLSFLIRGGNALVPYSRR